MADTIRHFVPNDDGWLLHLEQTRNDATFNPALPPVAIIPGYGMNGFIFGFHPRGVSMRDALAERGLEVWTLNLRAQGGSRPLSRHAAGPSIRALADVDLLAAVRAIRQRTASTAARVDLIGCSLGGTLAYAIVALHPDAPIGAVVAVGAPLRWLDPHPALKLLTRSPELVGLVRASGTRRAAELALPILVRFPRLLGVYMNADHVDLTRAAELVKTVEDPSPAVNVEIARWVHATDLTIRGVNVTEGIRRTQSPLLIVQANRDGIVPAETALSARDAWGGPVDIVRVGDASRWYSHADLFVGDFAVDDVFTPLGDWLLAARRAPDA